MASDLRGWETDPLFAAAEVVQDSADRMQTIYRLALHESSLIGGDHHDSNVVASLKLHQRDLVTAIETTKWQLEDFEKAASLSIIRSKLRTREILVARYRQFVEAIREQICQIEKNLDYSSLRDSIVDTSHVSLNTREEDNLALFLSGVMANPVNNYTKDSCIVEGFLDATDASCSLASTNEIVEERTEDTGNIIMKGAANFIQDSSKRSKSSCAKNGDWDLEAFNSKCEISLRNKFKELINRMSIFFNFFGRLSSLYESRINRNSTRISKDEEQRHYPPLNIFQRTKSHHIHARKWSASALIRFQVLYSQLTTRIIHSSNHRYACMRRPVQSMITLIVAALFFGVMVLHVSRM
uniref:Syntaxin 6/10/61 N-terminal domain-containing protein n=2 Tax=Kalanchoe fedtschenkoi TaxID=63787 RepID=A0A7N0TGZ2_KALFE